MTSNRSEKPVTAKTISSAVKRGLAKGSSPINISPGMKQALTSKSKGTKLKNA